MGVEILYVVIKEIFVKCDAYAQKQLCVNALALENFVDVSAVTVKVVSEPYDGAVLATQLIFNNFTDINIAHKAKKAEPGCTYSCLRHRQAPRPQNKCTRFRPNVAVGFFCIP